MTSKANNYLEVQVQTASKEQLLLMLYDGALRFAEQAQRSIEAREIEASHNALVRVKAIVVELMCSLDKRVGEELYSNLTGLYNFVYMRLVQANFHKDMKALTEAVDILKTLRATWAEAIQKNAKEGHGHNYTPPQESSFSIQG